MMNVKTIAILALALSIIAIILVVAVVIGTTSEGVAPLGLLGTTTTPRSCSDTDGGKVYTIKGTVSGYYIGNPYSYTDYCTSGTALKEYYCSSRRQYSTSYTCSGTTNICVDGACVQQTTTTTTTTTTMPVTTTIPATTTTMPVTTTTIPRSCSDTDGGIVYTIKGTVSGYKYGQPYSYTDFCNTTAILNEYYCTGVYYTWTSGNCASNTTTQCVDGACI
jgi:hypothetical protein